MAGGDDESDFPGRIYPLGARLLAWLAPESDAPLVEVPVPEWTGAAAPKEGGVFYRQEILRQIRAAYQSSARIPLNASSHSEETALSARLRSAI